MAKTKISEFSATPANNTDIDSINIAEGCAPSGINDAIRELMSQLKDFQTGAVGDSFNGPVGTSTAAAGAFTTLTASSTLGVTGVATLGAGAILNTPASVTLTNATGLPLTTGTTGTLATTKGGTGLTSFTANGVVYASSSSALATGSALTFNGTTLQAPQFYQTQSLAGAYNSQVLENSSSTGYSQFLFNVGSGGANGQASISYAPTLFFSIGPSANDTTTPIVFRVNNGSEQMRLTSTGLGIGTSSPAYKVNAVVPSAADAFFADANNLAYSGYRIRAGVSGQQWAFRGGTSTMGLTDVTAGIDRLVIDLSGNLGLGVTLSAWASSVRALELPTGAFYSFASGSVSNFYNLTNAYLNSAGNPIYKQTAPATQYLQTAGQHQWYNAASGTAGNAITFTQALTLDANGRLIIGNTSTIGPAKINSYFDGATEDGLDFKNTNTGNTGSFVGFFNSSGGVAGSISQSSATTVLYNVTSDQRLKENITDADSASALIDAIQVRKFDWITDKTHQRYGFIAQELVTVSPEAVHQPADTEEMMAVDYSKLVPMLVKEIQSLRKRLADAGI